MDVSVPEREVRICAEGVTMFFLRTCRAVVVIASTLLAVHALAEQANNASGSVTVNGQAVALHHAYARYDAQDKSTRVLITDRALDATMLAEESSGEFSAERPSFRELSKRGEATGIELFINGENEVETVEVFSKAFGMPTPTSGRKFWYEPYRLSAGWIGGRSRSKQAETFFKLVWQYDVSFLTTIGQKGFEIPSASALAVARKASDARETARIVPVGGGEEGAAYLAYRRSLDARDGKALVGQLTASMKNAIAANMHASPLTESALGSWAFMQTMPPGKVEVVGGVRDPEGTTLELRKTLTTGGTKTFGTAKLVKEQGVWKIAQDNWR
jgi:hypothetical protein